MNKYLYNFFLYFFENSSIHGFPYVSRKNFHYIEKFFWFTILTFSVYCAYHAFSGQWKRYTENPTVLSIELLTYAEFDRPSFTVCTDYNHDGFIQNVTKEAFPNEVSNEKFEIYKEFVKTVLLTNYSNLEAFEKYENHPEFHNANFLQIARTVENFFLPPSDFFKFVMTELGMCQSSSKYNYFLDPSNVDKKPALNLTIPKPEKCSSLEVCRISVSPKAKNNETGKLLNTVYINSYQEIISGDDMEKATLTDMSIEERTIKIDQIFADPVIKKFSARSRKCLFSDESPSKYFDIYTGNLCKIDCRINRALKFCKCVPFLYPIYGVTFCNATGLVCLSKTDWYNATNCYCMSLCELTLLTKVSSKEQNLKFDKMITVDLVFPKTRIQRSVLFDFSDLIVGLGGSAALFLGFSFLCGVELFYFIIEYCIEAIINLTKPSSIR